MFNNSQNVNITGGSFNISVNKSSPLDALYIRAAPNAILNAGGRADEVRCHPGTREEVLRRIETWRDGQDSGMPPIFWLSGPAGAGKTAIVQTLAERCKAQDVHQANFFFFRADPSRNSLPPLIATLLHQTVLLFGLPLRDLVADMLFNNPLILDATLEDQLTQLIVIPLQTIRESSSSFVPLLIMVDGLDECESEEKRGQRQILHAFDKVLMLHPGLFRLLVASRDESQIRAAFNDTSCQVLPLYLDGQYSAEHDIRIFVNDEFRRIQRTHPLADTLSAIWPPVEDVEDIIKKSSGHFIYAATIMRFIIHSSASPMLSLARAQGAAQITTKSPFSYLDAIYTYILSQVDDQETLKAVLHAQLLVQDAARSPYGRAYSTREMDFTQLLRLYDPKYTRPIILSCLADLTPLVWYTTQYQWLKATNKYSLRFHHASFPDYLLDHSRSGDYYVDLDAFSFNVQPIVWEELQLSQKRPGTGVDIVAYSGLFRLRRLPPGFLNILNMLNPSHFDKMANGNIEVADILKHLHDLCTCDDDISNYKRILRQWINTRPVDLMLRNTDTKWPPCSERYLAMACVNRDITIEPSGNIDTALRPKTDFDTHEISLWLNELLHRMFTEIYGSNVQAYALLLRQWMSWAATNNIPMDGAYALPHAWKYLQKITTEKLDPNDMQLCSPTWDEDGLLMLGASARSGDPNN